MYFCFPSLVAGFIHENKQQLQQNFSNVANTPHVVNDKLFFEKIFGML